LYRDPQTSTQDALSIVFDAAGKTRKVEFPTYEASQFHPEDLPQLQEIDLSMQLLAKAFPFPQRRFSWPKLDIFSRRS